MRTLTHLVPFVLVSSGIDGSTHGTRSRRSDQRLRGPDCEL